MALNPTVRRAGLWAGAMVSIGIAIALITGVGLPQRADYSGQYIAGTGYVAPEIGAIAPPFSLPLLRGKSLDLSDTRGSVVVVNFWATWCVPCVVEMPMLQDVYDDYENLRILAINMGEGRSVVAQWVQDAGLTFDILLDAVRSVERDYALRGLPSTVVIAPDGVIIAIYYGPIAEQALRAVLAPYVKERGI